MRIGTPRLVHEGPHFGTGWTFVSVEQGEKGGIFLGGGGGGLVDSMISKAV